MSFAVAIGCGLVIGAIIIIVDSRRNNRTDVGSLAQTPETEVQSTETQDLPERPIDQELELPDQDLQQIRSSKLHRHTKELARVLGGSDDAAVSAQVIGYDEARAAAIKGAKNGEDRKYSTHRTLRCGLDILVLGGLAFGILSLLAVESSSSSLLWLAETYPTEYESLAGARLRLAEALTAVVRSEAALYVKLRMQELMNGVGVSGILY